MLRLWRLCEPKVQGQDVSFNETVSQGLRGSLLKTFVELNIQWEEGVCNGDPISVLRLLIA